MSEDAKATDSPPSSEATDEQPRTAPKAATRTTKKKRRRSTKKRQPVRPSTRQRTLPTARIAFAKQLDLLRAYANVGGEGRPVTNEDVARIVGMAASTVSLANPFFADAGLVLRIEGGYVPSPEVKSFARTYRWQGEDAARELAPALRRTWFAQILLPRLGYAPLSERDALAELDKEATAGPDYEPQLRMLLDFLEAAHLIMRNGEMVEPGDADTHAPRPIEPPEREPEFRPSPPPATGRHPLIEGLLRELPEEGGSWTSQERDRWLALAKLTVEMLFELEGAEADGRPEPEASAMPHQAGPAVP